VAASEVFGIGATRIEERMLASKGKLSKTPVEFIASEGVEFAGVLFLLPSLLNTGLLSYKNHYNDLSGYYDLDTIILTLAFMYLCRIKNVEKLKHHNPGEFGKLLGLDRIPEARNLRAKLSMIYEQKKAQQWNRELASIWVESEENVFYYIDGHVKVYNGYKANLGKKHVARLKLCLPGMTEFWVNNSKGMPYFVVTGEVNEKLQEVIEKKIIPELKEHVALEITKEQLESDPDLPRFTLVFDREAYSPEFFSRLWKEHRIAIITYRKNVKDTWEQEDFSKHTIKIDGNEVEMELGEKNVELNDVTLREIRKKNSSSHQTSIITTNKKLTTIIIAIKMFARWTQENFFKYLRQEYDLDRIVHYVLNEIDSDIKVVNPLHRKLSNQIKKVREKIARRKARLYQLVHENIEDDPDKTEKNLDNQSKTSEELKDLETEEKELLGQRKEQSYKITIKEMEDEIKYNKLDLESKLLQNIIKMICYRAETSFSILLASNYKKKVNEMRALTKSLINSKANIKPDYNNQRLTIELYSQSNPRDNKMVREICQVLNESQTKFPGTDLKLIYKFASDNFTRDQEF
jgi:Skp family chaperone for outer membrane proteins